MPEIPKVLAKWPPLFLLVPGKDRSLRNAIFQMSQPTLLFTPSSEGKASVLYKLHDYSCHLLVQQESKKLADEGTVPDSVIGRCQIYKLLVVKAKLLFYTSSMIIRVICLSDRSLKSLQMKARCQTAS